jgi:hypothetical protein
MSVWRLWSQGNEVYLSIRSMIQSVKISLHSSGNWFFEFSDKSGSKIKRPAPEPNGFVKGPGIVYIGEITDQPLSGTHEITDAEIRWYPEPKSKRKRVFVIFFIPKNLDEKEIIENIPFEVVAKLELREKENVWLFSYEDDLLPSEEKVILDTKNQLKIHFKQTPPENFDSQAFMYFENEKGEMVLAVSKPGRENLVIDPPE